MKNPSKARPPSAKYQNSAINQSFDNYRKAPPLHIQDLKGAFDYNDSIDLNKNDNLPKKVTNFLRRASPDPYNSKKNAKFYEQSETLPDRDYSFQHESLRKSTSSKEDSTRPNDFLNRSFMQRSRGPYKVTEDIKQDHYLRSENSLAKDSSLFSKNKNLFQSQSRDGRQINKAPKPPAKNPEKSKEKNKSTEKPKKKANSTLRGSKVSVNQSFGIAETSLRKTRSYNSQERPSSVEKTSKPQSIERKKAPVKRRKEDEFKKAKSFINYGKGKEDDSIMHDKGLSFLETRTLNFEDTKDTKSGDTVIDFTGLNEKEILDVSSGLVGYYDLLIERGQVNSKLLCNLRDNFSTITEEFVKNHQKIKYYDNIKEEFEQERGKAKREKELLEYKLDVLTRENERLKNLNLQYTKHDESQSLKEASYISKEIHDAIQEEKKLVDLLHQREDLISFLKAKEDRYVSLLKAVGAAGIDVEKLYEEETKKGTNFQDKPEKLRKERTPERSQDMSNGDASWPKFLKVYKPNRIKKSKQGHISEDERSILKQGDKFVESYDQNEKKMLPVSKNMLPNYGQHYWERQFTEPSYSKASVINSEAFRSSPTSQQDEGSSQYVAFSVLERGSDANPDTIQTIPVRDNDIKERVEEESPTLLKDKLKLNLDAVHQKLIKEYHDEFMDKWNEFTSSWKRAIRQDKTYQNSS